MRRPSSFAGLLGAAAGAALSTLPSLVPRAALIQGLLIGVLAAIGYGLGALCGAVVRRARHQPGWRAGSGTRRVAAACSSALVSASLVQGWIWQADLARIAGLASPAATWIPIAAVAGGVVFLVLLAVARGVRSLTRRLSCGLERFTSPRTATVSAVTLSVLLGAVVVDQIPTATVRLLSPLFQSANNTTPTGVHPPTSPVVSGGPTSAIAWAELGSQGQAFVTGATPTASLAAFNGTPAKEPIRVFVGIESADTPTGRAQLVVAELERFGAFSRKVIAIGTSAGAGTVDPGEVIPLEYLANGDVATVSTQYSLLPSFLSFLVDRPNSVAESVAVIDAVRARLTQMPAEQRPRLVVFGESLGAYGASGAFADLPDLLARTDGAMFQGPPEATALWRRYTDARQPGTPERLPVYDDGRNLRWANQPEDLAEPVTAFDAPRVVYMQNASDPVVWWSPALLWDRPDWLAEPRGPGVMTWPWLPLVSFAGLTGDLMNSMGVPAGHGHVYGTYPVDAWADILRPPHWTPRDTQRLQQELGG